MPLTVIRDYFRNLFGVGVSSAPYTVKRLADDVTLASGTTQTDADPATALAGMLAVDEATLGYPGPIKYTVTDPVTNEVRVHTSKSVGIVGPWRSVDITRLYGLLGDGVAPGVLTELQVTANGTMQLSVGSGVALIRMGEHALLYSRPSPAQVTLGAAHPTLDRIDTVALRAIPPGEAEEGRIDLVVLAGTPASSPQPPPLQQTSAVWEWPLADILVEAGVSGVSQGKVTDRRRYCFRMPEPLAPGDLLLVGADGKLTRLAAGTTGQYLRQGATVAEWSGLDDPLEVGQLRTIGNADIGYLAPSSTLWLHRLRTKGALPSVTLGTGLGMNGVVNVVQGNDTLMRITVTSGSSQRANAAALVVTFAQPRPDTNYQVFVFPGDTDAAVAMAEGHFWFDDANRSPTGFQLMTRPGSTTGLQSSTSYRLCILVVEWE